MATSTSIKPASFVRITTSSYHNHSSTKSDAKTIQRDVAKDTYGLSIGPMPPQEFLDRYLPKTRHLNRKVRKDTFHSVVSDDTDSGNVGRREAAMCKAFVDIMNEKNLCPGYVFVCTADNKDPNSASDMHSDVVVYEMSEEDDEDASICDWSRGHIFIEFKRAKYMDGFRHKFANDDDILDNPSVDATKARGQIFAYAALQMGHQFRKFVLAVGIYGNHACFYRFDPSSATVSETFDIHENARMLAEFFLRYSILTPAERGFDPTVTPATAAEKTLFCSCIKDYHQRVKDENLRQYPGIENIGDEGFPVSKVQVSDMDGSLRMYLVCKPKATPLNFVPCGRFTRGFIAVPAPSTPFSDRHSANDDREPGTSTLEDQKGKLYWLKDYWRPAGSESESDIYRHLKNHNVPNLPEIICGGDVLMDGEIQETDNDSLLADPDAFWRRPTAIIRHMVHHRIVQGLLIPIDCIEDAKETLRAGRDVLECIAGAFHEANVLHCDTSHGNVMLTEIRGNGTHQTAVLNDWDRAKRVGHKSTGYNPRTGTWQFISVELHRDPTKPYEIFDDLESLMWVIFFVGAHSFNKDSTDIVGFFDESREVAGGTTGRTMVGGDLKLLWLSGLNKHQINCPPLERFLQSFRVFHKERLDKTVRARDSQEKDAQDDLEAYKIHIQEDIYQLLSHFDDVLQDPVIDWTKYVINLDQPKPITIVQTQKNILKEQERVIKEAIWIGGGRDGIRKGDQTVTSRRQPKQSKSRPSKIRPRQARASRLTQLSPEPQIQTRSRATLAPIAEGDDTEGNKGVGSARCDGDAETINRQVSSYVLRPRKK